MPGFLLACRDANAQHAHVFVFKNYRDIGVVDLNGVCRRQVGDWSGLAVCIFEFHEKVVTMTVAALEALARSSLRPSNIDGLPGLIGA